MAWIAALSVIASGLVVLPPMAGAAGAPTVTVTSPAPDGDSGWYRAQPSVAIAASGSAGLTSLSYGFGGSPTTQTYSAPYPTSTTANASPSTPGSSTLTVTATDTTGATGSGSATIRWDPDAPSQPSSATWGAQVGGGLVSTGSSAFGTSTSTTICGFWSGSTDAVSGERDYRVQLAEASDFATVVADRFLAATNTCFTATDGVRSGHSYYFRVAARDVAGNVGSFSGPSGAMQVTDQQTGPVVVHAPVPTAFVDQDVPISLRATCATTGPCSARLFYRPTPISGAGAITADGWTRVDLTRGAATTVNGKTAYAWSGAIPGQRVTTAGVDYFVEAEDTYALTQMPGTTYAGTDSAPGIQPVAHSWYHVHVVSPPLVTHNPPLFAPSGQDLPLKVQATCSASCSGTLYFRTTTDDITSQPLLALPSWPRVTMTAEANPVSLAPAGQVVTFDGAIPAGYVDTRGVDYFLSVSDGTTTTWWPGSSYQGYYAPVDGMRTGYQHVHVLETPHIVHNPPQTAPYRQPIPIDATANCASNACTGTLYYRTTTSTALDASSAFATTSMTATPTTAPDGTTIDAFHGTIPASVADTRGVDYFFSVSDGPTTSWWPGTSSTDGYVPVAGTRVGYAHVRVLDAPHFADTPVATAPALRPLTINAPVTCATGTCSVTLYYASSTTSLAGPFHAIPMVKTSADTATPLGALATWSATIPGPEVTTTGLAYYMMAFDGYTHAYSPGTSYWGAYVPVDGAQVGVHPVRVLEPPHLIHAPVATAYYNQPIPIEARSNCATAACAGTLHWRTTGHAWNQATMTTRPPIPGAVAGDLWTYDATVPATGATTEGVDYWLSVSDGYVTDSSPTYHVTVQAPTAVIHVPVVTANPNQPIPIQAEVACSTGNCTATLSYRQTGAGLLSEPAWTTVTMNPAGAGTAIGQTSTITTYQATIPASVVTVRGVDYYLHVTDGFTDAYSPGSAYVGTQATAANGTQVRYFTIHVTEPIHFTHTPVVTASAGDRIHIVAQANCSTGACSGTMSYRTTVGLTTTPGLLNYLNGLPPFTAIPMTATVVQDLGSSGQILQFSADIPGSAVTTDGVDYSFHLTDGATNAYFPGTSYVGGAGSVDGLGAAWQHVVVSTVHPTGSIGGTVWLDRSNDAVRQSNEAVLAGVKVTLVNPGLDGVFGTTDDTRTTTTTVDDGSYQFSGQLPGTYRAVVDATTAPPGTVPTTPTTVTVSVPVGGAAYGKDFGFRYDAKISGAVFYDPNANVTQDSSEAGIGGVRVVLTNPGGDGVFATSDDSTAATTTAADGTYTVDGLAPGTYRVDPDATSLTAQTAMASAHPITVTVAAHQQVTGVAFGIASPPAAPNGVTATAGNAQATVTWTAPANNGSPVSSYTVTANPGGATATVSAATTTATVTGLTNGTSYTFTVTATNAAGTGPASSPSSAVTPLGPPTAPTGATATAGNTQATVTWAAPASNGGSAITAYTVTAAPGGRTATVNAPATTATVTGLTNGTSYTFTVVATNAIGTSPPSPPSNAVTPATTPNAPTNVTAAAGNTQAQVSWTAPPSDGGSPITSYTVTASPGGRTATVSAPATSATVTGLTNGTSYTFTVVAANAVGTGPASAPSNPVTPRTVPGAPNNVTATAGDAHATLTWAPPASNGGSAIVSYTVTASPGGQTVTVAAPATTATVSGLTNGTTYTFTVAATNAVGTGVPSSPSNAVTPAMLPGPPTNVAATAGIAQATVTWTPPAFSGGAPIDSYTVTASPGGQTVTVSGSTTTATVTNLTISVTFTFSVFATNRVGSSDPSAPSNPVVPYAVAPGQPTGVTIAAGNASALVSWAPPASDGGSTITAYRLAASNGAGAISVSGPATSAVFPGLTNGTGYSVTVTAMNAIGAGTMSASSPVATPNPSGRLFPATGLANIVSASSASVLGNGPSTSPAVSANGRYVAFVSTATNLVTGVTGTQVYRRDTTTGQTVLVSVNTQGGGGTGTSGNPAITPDGRYVAFDSDATNLVAADTNGFRDVFMRDMVNGTTTLVSLSGTGAQGTNDSYRPSLSDNANRIVFTSRAPNLVASDRNGVNEDVFVRDRAAGTTVLVDATGFSGALNDADGTTPQAWLARSGRQSISGDGRYVTFTGHREGGALHSDRCSGSYDIPDAYVTDLTSAAVTRVGPAEFIGCDGAGYGSADTIANIPSISRNGKIIAFIDMNTRLSYFTTSGSALGAVNLTANGATPNSFADDPYLSSDGRRAIFNTAASNIVAGDTNAASDVYYVDTLFNGGYLASANIAGVPASGSSARPELSGDGSIAVFDSTAADIAPGDTNGVSDVFRLKLALPVNPLTAGEQAGGGHNRSELCACLFAGHNNATNNPVNTATGEFWHTFDDLSVPGRGPALAFSHTYSSARAIVNGPLGYGWTHSYNVSLAFGAGSPPATVTVNQDDGSEVGFSAQSDGTWAAPPRVFATLAHNGDGTWTFIRRARETLTFDSTGRLTAIRDLNGSTTTLTYPNPATVAVTDPGGRTLTLGYSGSHITTVTDPAGRTVTFAYNDGNGNLTDMTDVGGGVWHFTYDPNHRLVTMLNPVQAGAPSPTALTNAYDAQGRVVSQSDYLGHTTTFDYTSIPGSTRITAPSGKVTVRVYQAGLLMAETAGYGTAQAATATYSYDPETLAVTSVTDPNGHTRTNSWDANGNLTSTTDPLGRTTVNTFNAMNEVTSTTDPNGVTTTMVYDANGNLLSRSTPLSGTNQTQTTTFTHGDPSHPGDVTAVTDPDGKVWTSTYDTDGNTVTAADPLGNVTRSCYNAIGRPTATISPRGSAAGVTCSTSAPAPFTTYVSYNPYGQPLTVTDPLGHVTTKTYDADGNLATATDPDGNQTAYSYDAGDEPVTTTRADQTVTHAAYDPDGNLTSQTDAAGHATTYAFGDPGLAHLPTTATDPNGRITSYGYDRAGNLITKSDPGGTCSGPTSAGCTTMAYDPSGEIIARNYSDGTTPNVTIAYDADGQRTSMVDGTGTSTWVYDSLGRLTSQTNGAGQTVGYGYDLRSNLTSITYPGTTGTVTRTFDDAGRLSKIRDWANHETVFSYNADSFMTSQAYPNGTTATYTPDGADRLMAISHAPTPTPNLPFATFTYGRDNANQLTSVTSTGVPADNHTYAYTSLNQLQKADNQNTWGYDPADNPTALSGGTVQAFDGANQLCWTATTAGTSCASPPSGATTYQYDNRGNRTGITTGGAATTLTYDQADRLTAYGSGVTDTYNGDGLRMSKTVSGATTAFTWDLAEGLPLLLVDGTRTYVYGPAGLPLEQISSGGTVTYYHHDQLGSTRVLTNSAGAVVATYTYDPYGKLTASQGSATNPFSYAGQYTDQETGLVYLRARFYDPATSQFLTRDPLEAETHSAYGYTDNDPFNLTDPSGLCKLGIFGRHCGLVSTLHELVTHPVESWKAGAPDYVALNPSLCVTGTACFGFNLTVTRYGHVFMGYETGAGDPGFLFGIREGWLDQSHRANSCEIDDFVAGTSANVELFVSLDGVGPDAAKVLSNKSDGSYQTATEVGIGFGSDHTMSSSADYLHRVR